MNKKTINCINSTNGKSINENEKRSLRTRLLELKDEGYTAEEIKAIMQNENIKNAIKDIPTDANIVAGKSEEFNRIFEKRAMENKLDILGKTILEGRSKEDNVILSLLDMIEGTPLYQKSLAHQIESSNNLVGSKIISEIENILGDEYGILYKGFVGEQTPAMTNLSNDIAAEIMNSFNGETNNPKAMKIARLLAKTDDNYVKNLLPLHGVKVEKYKARSPLQQGHSREVLKKIGKDEWVKDVISSKLDHEATFGKKLNDVDLAFELPKIYDRIVNPSKYDLLSINDLDAKTQNSMFSIETPRQIFFSDAQSRNSYNKKYNNNQNIITSYLSSINKYNQLMTLNDNFGKNPFKNIESLITKINNDYDLNIDVKYDGNFIKGNNQSGKKIAEALKFAFGLDKADQTGFMKFQKIARNHTFYTKLGGLTLSMVSDPALMGGVRSMISGKHGEFLGAISDTVKGYTRQFDKKTAKDDLFTSHALGVSLRHITGELSNHFIDSGNSSGNVKEMMGKVFKDVSSFKFKEAWEKFDGVALSDSLVRMSSKMALVDKANLVHEKAAAGYSSAIAKDIKSGDVSPSVKNALNLAGLNDNDLKLMQSMIKMLDDGEEYFVPSSALDLSNEKIRSVLPDLSDDAIEKYKFKLGQKTQTVIDNIVNTSLNYKSAKTRRQMAFGLDADNPLRVASSVALDLKSFSWEFMNNFLYSFQNSKNLNNKAAYMAEFAATTTSLAYLSLSLKDIASNKTPRTLWTEEGDVNGEVVMDIMNYSGLLAIYGDVSMGMLGLGKNRFEQASSLETFLGPSYSQLYKLFETGIKTGKKYAEGEDMEEVYRGLGQTLNLAFRNAPMNNNIFLNMMLSYGFQEYYPSNIITNNAIAERQQQAMKKGNQDYMLQPNF